jgi:hypothetical protein
MFLWWFWRWRLLSYFSRLVLNLNPPDLSLPSSWDYRREPPAPGFLMNFFLPGLAFNHDPPNLCEPSHIPVTHLHMSFIRSFTYTYRLPHSYCFPCTCT